MVFKEALAEVYDLIYKDKNYEVECDFIEEIFQKYSGRYIKTMLDVGCGSGGHAIPLAKRGYDVVGFDLSEVMIRRAKEKAEGIANMKFQIMDLHNFKLNTKFDACICMFAVMGYVTENKDVQKALLNIRRHLEDQSLLIFDFWNGLAVLRILPSVRVNVIEDKGVRIIRTAEPELDAFNHICKVHYRLIITENNKVVDEVEETHVVRFYFPQEIKHHLEDAGFEVLKICPFLDLDGKVDENVWNIVAIAKAVGGKE